MAEATNTKLISDFFGKREGDKLTDYMEEYKKLTDEDKQQLGDGIRNGSLTY